LEQKRNRIDRAIQVLAGIRSGTISNRRATNGASLKSVMKRPRLQGGLPPVFGLVWPRNEIRNFDINNGTDSLTSRTVKVDSLGVDI